MKNVLIVDDEKSFLLSLADGLSAYAADFNVLTAENSKEAVDILKSAKVDLVITDLKMPEMDGFELLAYMSRNHPSIPVIVMTAFGSPEIEERLQAQGISLYLEKPVDFDILVSKIFEALTASASGYLTGISLATFLQLVEMEKKTYTLNIKSKGKVGHLYFQKGRLIDAETGGLQGKEAAYEIIGWDPVEIEIEGTCKKKKINIDSNLTHILMEGLRLKDEKNKNQSERREDERILKLETDEETIVSLVDMENEILQTHRKEEYIMSLENKLREFLEVDGFLAVGVFNPTGEALALFAADSKLNLKDIGALANNVLLNAQKVSREIGLGRGQMIHVEADHAHIFARCHNEGNDPIKSEPGKAHIHMIVIFKPDANVGLAKLKINSIITALAPELRF
ncbi:MAG: response regulator [Thermodesulfobacteriota bacterium]